jgi:Zn-dependent protease with chaperone function
MAIAPRRDFRAAQRRHRVEARIRAIPAILAAAVMGIPLSVYWSPLILAVAVVMIDLLNLVVPMPDLGGRLVAMLRELLLGGPQVGRAITLLALVWLLPGVIGVIVVVLLIRRRLSAVGGDAIARSLRARPPRPRDAEEQRLANIVSEYALAAGIRAPNVLIVGHGPMNATVYGPDPDSATLIIARPVVAGLDRESTQGVVARLVGSAVDGDLQLATVVGAVYVTYGFLTTILSAVVSPGAQARLRTSVRALRGRGPDPAGDSALAALVGLPIDDDFDRERGRGYVSLITMSGLIGAATSMVNLFLAGPLLVLAWRSRVFLADAVAVDLTRNPTALARALRAIGDRVGMPGSGWLELLLIAGSEAAPRYEWRRAGTISDGSLTAALAPPIAERIARLESMGADPSDARRATQTRRRRRMPTARSVAGVALMVIYEVVGLLATAGLVALIGLFAFFPLAVVIFPVNDFLRGLAGG